MCFIGLLKVEKVVPKAIWSWLTLNTDGWRANFLLPCLYSMHWVSHGHGMRGLVYMPSWGSNWPPFQVAVLCLVHDIPKKKSEHFQCRAGLVRIIKSLAHKWRTYQMRFTLEITVLELGKYLELVLLQIRIVSLKEKSEFFSSALFPSTAA